MNDVELLKGLKSKEIKMTLENKDLLEIIYSFIIPNQYYKTYEFLLFNYIQLTNENVVELIDLHDMKTPKTTKQQKNQFELYKRIIKEYPAFKKLVKDNFSFVIKSLNIPLVDFIIKELKFDFNELFYCFTVLQHVVFYLNDKPNINDEFAYEMFEYFLSIGADINKRDYHDNDIYFSINRIKDKTIKEPLLLKLSNLKSQVFITF